jgi:hypothetical protein
MFLAKYDMTLGLLVSDVSTSLGCIFHEEGARSAERHAAERPWHCTPSQPQEILTGRQYAGPYGLVQSGLVRVYLDRE